MIHEMAYLECGPRGRRKRDRRRAIDSGVPRPVSITPSEYFRRVMRSRDPRNFEPPGPASVFYDFRHRAHKSHPNGRVTIENWNSLKAIVNVGRWVCQEHVRVALQTPDEDLDTVGMLATSSTST